MTRDELIQEIACIIAGEETVEWKYKAKAVAVLVALTGMPASSVSALLDGGMVAVPAER
jgi:hypothetical protein